MYLVRFYMIIVSILIVSNFVSADSVYMNNGELYEGVVKEIYDDRIVLAEVRGELEILRTNIKKIQYDKEEMNLLSIGNEYFRKSRYQDALEYYEKALKVNPSFQDTRDAILKVRGVIFRKKDDLQRKRLNQRKNIQEWGDGMKKHAPKEKNVTINYDIRLEQIYGFTIKKDEYDYRFDQIIPNTQAADKHLFPGDVIYAVDGDPVKHWDLLRLQKKVFGKLHSNVKITIERKIVILRDKRYFFQNVWESIDSIWEQQPGYFRVKELAADGRSSWAGLKVNDRIVYVEEEAAHLMDLESAKRKVVGEEGSKLYLMIHRDIVMYHR